MRHIFSILCLILLTGQSLAAEKNLSFFAPYPKINEDLWYISHGWSNGPHQSCEWRKNAVFAKDNKLNLMLSDKGGLKRPIGCGELQSRGKFHYGRYEVRMRAAKGNDLNSSFFTYTGPPHGTDSHDEIDFEFLGKNPKEVEVTFWQNGEQFKVQKIPLGFDASEVLANYAFEWKPDSITWFVNDKEVFKTPEGTKIPSHPGKIFISLWSGAESTKQWLGPFHYKEPATAQYEWIKFTPFDKHE